MKSLTRLAALAAAGAVVGAACGNPVGDPTNTPTAPQADEAPANGGMYGSGHDALPTGGSTVVVPDDTTTRNGGMYGSGH
jgi:hypothetical protein